MSTDATPHSAKNKKIKFFSVRRARTNPPPPQKKKLLYERLKKPRYNEQSTSSKYFFFSKTEPKCVRAEDAREN